ncbi:MAG: flagellar biosynthetic protein FliO [Pseudomonadota bacterium]
MSLVSLGVVCLIAYVSLRLLARRGVGRAAGPIRVLARCPLEPRRSLYLVEAAGRCFLVGVGDGPMTMLAEVGAADMAAGAAPVALETGGRFVDVLARVRGRRAATGSGDAGPVHRDSAEAESARVNPT